MTYRELRDALGAMNSDTLDQHVMVHCHLAPEPVELLPVYGVLAVRELGQQTKSDDDNAHHPEQVVLCCDLFSFDEDGDDVIEMDPDFGDIGVRSGKVKS